jgi:hypothetical protein
MSDEQMREKVSEVVSRSPRALGYSQSRWTLDQLRSHLGADAPETASGLSRVLDRLGITHTRGQGYTLSPDEHFEAKRSFLEGVKARSRGEASSGKGSSEKASSNGTPDGDTTDGDTTDGDSGGVENSQDGKDCCNRRCKDRCKDRGSEDAGSDRVLYLDELTYELHPTIDKEWSPAPKQPTTERGTCEQKRGRLLAAMDAHTGTLFYQQASTVGREALVDLYQEMAKTYRGDRLWVVQDNAPVHFHEDVLRPLSPQVWPRAHPGFEYVRPPQWNDPTEAAEANGDLPVQIVPLPTYASWLNPIERLWRWLKQEVLHLHSYAGAWNRLKQGVRQFLNRFTEGSTALLEYTGLSGG